MATTTQCTRRKQPNLTAVKVHVESRDVKISRPAWSPNHFFGLGLGLTVTGLGLGLIKPWSRSHTFWSCGLKSIICSSTVMTF